MNPASEVLSTTAGLPANCREAPYMIAAAAMHTPATITTRRFATLDRGSIAVFDSAIATASIGYPRTTITLAARGVTNATLLLRRIISTYERVPYRVNYFASLP